MTRARTLSLLGNENNFTVTNTSPNRVGIGSTIPDAKLDVGGDIVVGTAITLGNVSGIVSATDFYVDGVSITGAAGTWATFTSGGEGGISTTKKVKIENGLEVTGISTFSGALTVGGVLTYDDVTNVDSIGIITARSHVSIADSILHTGDTDTAIRFPAADTFTVETGGSERLRITNAGDILVAKTTTALDTAGSRLSSGLVAASGDSNSTNLATNSGGNLSLANVDSTDNNFSNIGGYNSNGLVVNQIDFINTSHSSRTGEIAFLTHNGSNLTERLRIDSSGDVHIGDNSSNANGHGLLSLTQNASAAFNALVIQQGNTAFTATDGLHIGIDASVDSYIKTFENRDIYFTTGTTNTEKFRINNDGSIVPGDDNTQDLGSTSLRWANIYSADLQLSNEGSSNDVDGTWGKYTIQEGENDLFLLNRRNGKKYRFMLEEV